MWRCWAACLDTPRASPTSLHVAPDSPGGLDEVAEQVVGEGVQLVLLQRCGPQLGERVVGRLLLDRRDQDLELRHASTIG